MRKLKLLAFAFVLGTATMFATNGEPVDDTSNQIRNEIVQLLDAPNFVVEDEMNINVTFTFNSEGQIVVLEVNSYDDGVLDYVRKNINGKYLQQPGEQNKRYTMPLKIEEI